MTKQLVGMCLALVFVAGATESAPAQQAGPPLGVWNGHFQDGSGTLSVTLSGNGSFGLFITGGAPVTGTWTWSGNSTGGVLTLHYRNAGLHNRLYFSVTYLNGRTISFSDPFFRVTLNRL
jgi:hypothetical protein